MRRKDTVSISTRTVHGIGPAAAKKVVAAGGTGVVAVMKQVWADAAGQEPRHNGAPAEGCAVDAMRRAAIEVAGGMST